VFSVRNGPQSLNWFARHDSTTQLVFLLTHGRLIRVNQVTQSVEPSLAERWTRSDDGRRYTVTLRPGLRFSDGVPLTADDVVFSFKAALDPQSALRDVLIWDGEPIRVEARGDAVVDVIFPRPFGPGLRVLDTVPIVPRHKLADAVARGALASAWSATADPGEIAGLGPFRLAEHRPGERLVFERNPHYDRRDEQGRPLPRLDRLVLQILPDQDTQMLSLESGDTDGSASEIRPTDYATARRLADAGRIQLLDLGVGLAPDGLWINLKPGAFASDSRAAWIQRDELRQAISLGVDRQQFTDTVFSGAATPLSGPVSPANRQWFSEAGGPRHADATLARARLASIGLVDRDGDGFVDDRGTRHARFTLLTQKGQSSLERGAAAIREQLRPIGLEVDVQALDAATLIQRFLSGANYDAVYFNLSSTDSDPAAQLDFWRSDGASHVWNLGPQHEVLAWEREIDALMAQQVAALDQQERVRLFADVQRIFAAHEPIVYFAVPRMFVAASSRLTGLTPAIRRPQLLWAPDTIDIKP
jgi:peptide/nickel transport system substrate-binding protein